MNNINFDIKTFLKKYQYIVFEKRKLTSRWTEIKFDMRYIRDESKFFEFLIEMKKEGLIDIKFKPTKPVDQFKAYYIVLNTENFSDTEFNAMRTLEKMALAYKHNNNRSIFLIPPEHIEDYFRNKTEYEIYLESHFNKNIIINKLVEVELYRKDKINFRIEKIEGSDLQDKFFFIKYDYIYLPKNIRKYPQRCLIKIHKKFWLLLKKLMFYSDSKRLKNSLSKYQREVYYLLRALGLINEEQKIRIGSRGPKRSIIIFDMILYYFLKWLCAGFKHFYNWYLFEKYKKKKGMNIKFNVENFSSFVNDILIKVFDFSPPI